MSSPDPAAHDLPPTPDGEPVGSIAEEAFRLFRAMATAQPTAETTTEATAEPMGAPTGESSAHVCSTSWCPVCQVVGFVRNNPEAVASVAASATVFAQSLRDLLNSARSPQEEQ